MEDAAGFWRADEIPLSRTHEVMTRMTGAVRRMAGAFERLVDGEPVQATPQPIIVRRVPRVGTARVVTTHTDTVVNPLKSAAPAPRRTAAARWYRGPLD